MKIFIAGVDGYLGWTLAQWLARRGHTVGGADNFARRSWVKEIGSQSAVPVAKIHDRLAAFEARYGAPLQFYRGDLSDYEFARRVLMAFEPDAIVHLGEMPSAPYSMIDAKHAAYTHTNNLVSTLNMLHLMRDAFPGCHLLKLGTMGEYGTPNVDIPEGFFNCKLRGREDWMMFPRKPGSFYHATKVHDTYNIEMACRLWGLRSTDIMQGVVYGTNYWDQEKDERLATRFDFDGVFGTAINRFCAQAVVGEPITPFGDGHQRRGFLPLQDSMQCFTLALENPPKAGEYRTLNQFEEVYDVTELAEKVAEAARGFRTFKLEPEIRNLCNPRKEAEEHYYNPDCNKLPDLGYVPAITMAEALHELIAVLVKYKGRIVACKDALMPDVRWDGTRGAMEYVK